MVAQLGEACSKWSASRLDQSLRTGRGSLEVRLKKAQGAQRHDGEKQGHQEPPFFVSLSSLFLLPLCSGAVKARIKSRSSESQAAV